MMLKKHADYFKQILQTFVIISPSIRAYLRLVFSERLLMRNHSEKLRIAIRNTTSKVSFLKMLQFIAM